MTTRVITISRQKGGTGKTTTAVNLTHPLSMKGKQVLLIDLDSQYQCTTNLGLEDQVAGRWAGYAQR